MAGWGLAADFEGQHGDQTPGPQGAPRTGAPTEGAKDAPFGRPVGFLAAQLPARVRRRPPACRSGGAAPGMAQGRRGSLAVAAVSA